MKGESTRYLIVMVAGYLLDLAVAMIFADGMNAPLVVAAIAGYVVAFIATYYLHARWTFRSKASIWSLKSLLGYSGAGVATLGTRTIILAPFFGVETLAWQNAVLLLGAAGVSAVINFVVIKFAVFNEADANNGRQQSRHIYAAVAFIGLLSVLFIALRSERIMPMFRFGISLDGLQQPLFITGFSVDQAEVIANNIMNLLVCMAVSGALVVSGLIAISRKNGAEERL